MNKNRNADKYIERRMRRFFVIVFLAMIALIVSIGTAQAKSKGPSPDRKSASLYRKQTIQYSKACNLLRMKWSEKPAAKKRTLKWR